MIMKKKSGLLMDAICVLFLLSLPNRSSSTSAVFDFNASLNDVAPISKMQFTVYCIEQRSGLVMDVICVLFLLHPQHRSSFVSVLFILNASLNDVASVLSILLTIDLMRTEE